MAAAQAKKWRWQKTIRGIEGVEMVFVQQQQQQQHGFVKVERTW